MINILLPMAGTSEVFNSPHYPYPLPLTEISGKPMIERVIKNLNAIRDDIRFIFVVKSDDCRRFHLDSTLSLLAPGKHEIVRLEGETQGALCSSLMAISYINNSDPLIISNFDQIIEGNISNLFSNLLDDKCDAGCLTFNSVHPRWSYVRSNGGLVVEAAEKNPISRHAIAGLYFFARGEYFVRAAMRTILNQASVNDRYFISLSFNALILEGKAIKPVEIPTGNYHSFYTPKRIEEYENLIAKK
jgi:dTDP-glucose pyrophosphorylase